MSDLLTLLNDDIEKREDQFIGRLHKHSPELVADYLRIVDLRKAADAVRNDPVKQNRRNGVTRSTSVRSESLPDGFVLMKEVRSAIRAINKPRFRSLDVYEVLAARFPAYITEDKKGTISATLSNLVAKGELDSESDGQRKVWYTVLRLRGDDSEAQRNLMDAE